jgi:hypothetical protein
MYRLGFLKKYRNHFPNSHKHIVAPLIEWSLFKYSDINILLFTKVWLLGKIDLFLALSLQFIASFKTVALYYVFPSFANCEPVLFLHFFTEWKDTTNRFLLQDPQAIFKYVLLLFFSHFFSCIFSQQVLLHDFKFENDLKMQFTF